MASISIQFHALPEELVPLLRSFAEEVAAHVIEVRFPPFSASVISTAALAEPRNDRSPWRVLLTAVPPTLPADGMNELLDKNPGALVVDIGGVTIDGLQES